MSSRAKYRQNEYKSNDYLFDGKYRHFSLWEFSFFFIYFNAVSERATRHFISRALPILKLRSFVQQRARNNAYRLMSKNIEAAAAVLEAREFQRIPACTVLQNFSRSRLFRRGYLKRAARGAYQRCH